MLACMAYQVGDALFVGETWFMPRETGFLRMRSARDATLAMPVLMLPAVQINIRAGEMPPAEANGVAYLKIPLNAV